MRVLKPLLLTLLIGTLGSIGLAEASQGDDRASLAGKIFYVDATILSSPSFPEYEGFVIQSCFWFEEDGTWIDLEWPGEGLEPIPGVWIQHTESPFINFTAFARWPDLGWTLVEDGVVSLGEKAKKGRLRTNATVFSETNEVVFYLSVEGHDVESCPL